MNLFKDDTHLTMYTFTKVNISLDSQNKTIN